MNSVMGAHDLRRYLDWFQSYVGEFYVGTDEDLANIELKRVHSLRVLHEAKLLTASLKIPFPLVDIIHIAALLHDIGRFPQYSKYKTFNDRESLNHARLGVTVLRRARILSNLSPKQRGLVLGAIFLHNRASLPDKLSSTQSLLARIIRDADKLDIIPTVIANLDPEAPSNRIVSLGLSSDPDRYSKAVYEKISMRQPVDMNEMNWLNDFKLMLLGWLHTLNFPASRKAVLERRYIERLTAILPSRPELIALGEEIHSQLRKSLGK